MKPIEVRIPHGLERAEVRRRLDRAVLHARNEYADHVGEIETAWQGEDRLDVGVTVMGMRVDSELEILATELLVRVELPAMAGLFAGRIRDSLAERLGGLLGPPGG